MKKIFFLLILITSIDVSAQIQRKMLGLTLGVTKYSQTYNILKSQSYSIGSNAVREQFIIDKVTVGGYYWDKIEIDFYKGILFSIKFSGNIDKRNCDYRKLESSLNNLYKQYKTTEGYDDGTTIIETYFKDYIFGSSESNLCYITYKHKAFVTKMKNEASTFW